jgi:hypothetical protein
MANRLSSPMSNHISKRNCGGCSLVSLIRERILSVLAGSFMHGTIAVFVGDPSSGRCRFDAHGAKRGADGLGARSSFISDLPRKLRASAPRAESSSVITPNCPLGAGTSGGAFRSWLS